MFNNNWQNAERIMWLQLSQQTWDNQTKYLFEEEYHMLRTTKSKPLFEPASLDLNPV